MDEGKPATGHEAPIITADDFGLSDEVTAAILQAFVMGVVTHASIMVNMPAFENACELARERGLLDRIGVHLVLTEGEPLTEPIRFCKRFCDPEGLFRYWRGEDRAFRLASGDREAVQRELRVQIQRCRDHGLPVGHVDSHHHVHNKRAIGNIVLELARELDVPRIRLAHNSGPRIGFVNRAYKARFNARVRRAGLAGTRWYGSVDDYRHMKMSGLSEVSLVSFEVNTHPVFRSGLLVDLAHPELPLDQLVEPVRALRKAMR